MIVVTVAFSLSLLYYFIVEANQPMGNLRNYMRNAIAQRRRIPTRSATKMGFGPVYVLGVVAGNTTSHMAWDVVKVYGSFERSFNKIFLNVTCCLMYGNQGNLKVIQQNVSRLRLHPNEAAVTSFHIVCPNVHYSVGGVPLAVGLSRKGLRCDNMEDRYVKVEFPYQEPGFKVAIGTQISYKNISAELIIEWLEAYKILQVDKVVSYYHRNINQDALNALTYYHNTGFVDLYEFILPAEDKFPRKFRHGSSQLYNDLRLAVHDSFEKMSGYTYFGIIDFDEFLIPPGNKTLKEMLIDLKTIYKSAAGFVFKSQYFYLSWGKSSNASDLILGQYVSRRAAEPTRDRPKQIYLPMKVRHGAVSTHYFRPVKNSGRVQVPSSKGFIHHFRSCRAKHTQISFDDCAAANDRVTDRKVADWSTRIENNVRFARRQIFGT